MEVPSQIMEKCQYYYSDLAFMTSPDRRTALPLRRVWWKTKRYLWHTRVLGPRESTRRMLRHIGTSKPSSEKNTKSNVISNVREALNLQPGDWVEVRSEKEILATLDSRGKLGGLSFTFEMVKFCGRRFRVYKRVNRIILEATGELRGIKTPTVLLEDVFCDGQAHGGCDRACFCFWREDWLKRTSKIIQE